MYIQQKREYHINEKCEYLTYLNYEEIHSCMICSDETADVLNSRIRSKMLGFVAGKKQYQDDECLLGCQNRTKS